MARNRARSAAWSVVAAAALLAGAVSARARDAPLTLPTPLQFDSTLAPPTVLALAPDDSARMTVPVMVDGRGPFAFVVDTGADRTVISQELAAQLHLPAGPPTLVHATSGEALAPSVVLDALDVGRLHLHNIHAPVFTRANLGADGMIGVDALHQQDMVMDFKVKQFAVRATEPDVDSSHTVTVYGRNLYGELVLVDARIDGRPIYVVLDSGAQNTIANLSLLRMLEKRAPPKSLAQVQILSVTGGQTPAELAVLPEVEVGEVVLRNLPVGFADLHTFARLHLDDRPAMLLGMDVLQQFDRVAVDFRHKRVSFRFREGT